MMISRRKEEIWQDLNRISGKFHFTLFETSIVAYWHVTRIWSDNLIVDFVSPPIPSPHIMTTLPIIDISPFLDSSSSPSARTKTARALDHACRTVGFFYLKSHNIPSTELLTILSLANSFFALSTPEKESLRLKPAGVEDGDGARGYQTIGENVTQGKRDWHEGLDLYRPVSVAEEPYAPIMGINKWPPGDFKRVYEGYIEKLLVLGKAVMRAIAVGLGVSEDYFQGMVDESFWVMRAIGYPPLENGDDGGISCGEHTGESYVTC
jgi:isopenicillin N synthase-like dioxygenase